MDNLVLIGMPGSGKSTVGVLLAKALGLSFVDVDLVIQRREGALLQEILDTQGAEAFLDAEEEAVLSLQCQNAVIAPGGSAVCREKGALYLKELGRVIYLRVPLEELESYDLYLWLTDVDGGQSSAVKKVSFTTVDGTPPRFNTNPTVNKVNATSVGLYVT